MKKCLAIFLALTMLFALCACGSEEKKNDSANVPAADVHVPEGADELKPWSDDTPASPAPSGSGLTAVLPETEQPRAAADYAELFQLLNANNVNTAASSMRGELAVAEEAEAPMEMPMPAAADAPADNAVKAEGGYGADSVAFSGTNVQVEGIDEGDIVKTDGKYIYVMRGGNELVILQAAGENTKVLSRTVIGSSDYSEDKGEKTYHYRAESRYGEQMFVSGSRLAVIGGYDRYEERNENGEYHYDSENYTFVDIYDVSDPAAPKLLSQLGQDGYVRDTRMMNGKVYVISNYYVWSGFDEDDPETFVPRLYKNGVQTAVAADSIIICPTGESHSYTVLCCYDIADAVLEDDLTVMGGGSTVYMNGENLYLMGSNRTNELTATYEESVYTVSEHLNASETVIHRVSLSDGLMLAASGTVPGYLDSQFSADEYNGYLRLVTTRNDSTYKIYEDKEYGFQNYVWGEDNTDNCLYILDESLAVVGSIEGLAEGEYIYSARFDGDIAYFCTYRSVDPLFAVDCSDPAAPVVLSALKISGFSEYLHSWGADKLFGFGRETNEETGWSEGLKLVMFDTSDKSDVKVENYLVLDDLYYSEALYNHKAFFIDYSKNIIGFLGDDDYYIFSYSQEEGFKELSHFWFDTYEWNVRGMWIEDWAYIVGYEEAMLIDMTTWDAPLPLNLN